MIRIFFTYSKFITFIPLADKTRTIMNLKCIGCEFTILFILSLDVLI